MSQSDLLKRSRIPVNHQECLLSEIPDDLPYKRQIADYIDNLRENVDQGKGLYLWGDYGTGKTGCAAIIAKAALSKGIMPCWIAAENIPTYMVEDIYFEHDILMKERVFEVDLLVIDDLRLRDQRNIKSDWIERWLESIIRRRMDDKRPTILTSNNSKHELKKLKAVYAITQEAVTFVEVKGKDFRGKT